ncbi:MAG: hypothetical protein WD059_06790 [Balneolaceae bacterium]
MSKKKSLGHNPLAYSMLGHASFDFIPNNEEKKRKAADKSEKNKTSKITVSYYLEEHLVEHIKNLAEENHTSYSSMISQMLKNGLKDISED